MYAHVISMIKQTLPLRMRDCNMYSMSAHCGGAWERFYTMKRAALCVFGLWGIFKVTPAFTLKNLVVIKEGF